MATQKPRKRNVTGRTLNNNAASAMRYGRALNALRRRMVREVQEAIKNIMRAPDSKAFFAQDADEPTPDAGSFNITATLTQTLDGLTAKFESLFDRDSWKLANTMAEAAATTSKNNLKSSTLSALSDAAAINVPPITGRVKEIYDAAVQENVGLIKSIPSQYMQKVQGAVMRSVTSGQGLADLVPALQKLSGQSERRVLNLARDQTRKVYNSLNKQRMQDMGVQGFEWIHSGGSNDPRKLHLELDGQTFRFDDLPVIDDRTGERGTPGQLPNCGCTMKPVFIFDDDK